MAAIRSNKFRLVAILAVLLLGAAWLLWPRSGGEKAAGGQASACEVILFEGSRFTACRYRRGEDRIEFVLDPGG